MQQILFNRRFEHHAKGVCAAIGMFDGVHLGHQGVVKQVLEDAKKMDAIPVVITFDKHPVSILNPLRAPRLIYPLDVKLRLLESYGIAATMLIPFSEKISNYSAEYFFKVISTNLYPLLSISMGTSFSFAKNRSGNAEKIREIIALNPDIPQTQVHEITSICCEDTRISSTRIREDIRLGNLDQVKEMLGRPFSIISKVIPGNQIGRTINFPTANLDVRGRVIPPIGVYASKVVLDNRLFTGCFNIGLRPTLGCCAPELRAEVHILDFNEDIYGKTIEVFPVARLRDEEKFASLDELKQQICCDVEQTRALIENTPPKEK